MGWMDVRHAPSWGSALGGGPRPRFNPRPGPNPASCVLRAGRPADPADPDKPADVKGARDIAPSDVATAIKFCRVASAASRRALYQLGRAYASNQQLPAASDAHRKAAGKGSTSATHQL